VQKKRRNYHALLWFVDTPCANTSPTSRLRVRAALGSLELTVSAKRGFAAPALDGIAAFFISAGKNPCFFCTGARVFLCRAWAGSVGSQNGNFGSWAGGEKQKRGAGSIGGCLVVSVAAPQPLEVGGQIAQWGWDGGRNLSWIPPL